MSDGNDFSGVEKSAGLVRLDEGELRSHVDGVVRDTVEQTLNALLEAEARANALNFLRLGADSQDFFEGSRF